MAVLQFVSRYRWVIFAVAFLGQLGNSLAFQSIAPLAPLFQPEWGLTKAQVGLFSSMLFGGQWAFLLVGGALADRIGIRTVLTVGLAIIGGSLVFMLRAATFEQALVVMFLAGIGSSGVLPTVTKAISDWFPPAVRGTVMGMKQSAVPVGGMVAAAILPAVALAFGWRWAVGGVGLVGIAGAVISLVYYRDPPRPASSAGRKVGMREGLGAVTRNWRLWRLSFVSVLYVTVQLTVTTYTALYFMDVVLVTAVPDEAARIVAAGGFLAICQLGGSIDRVLWGLVSDRFFSGRRMVVLAITGAVAALFSLATSQLRADFPFWLLSAVVFMYGLTAVGWNGLYHVAMTETSGQKHAGTGVGLSMTLNQIGAVFGPPLFGYVVDVSGSYQPAWLLMGCCSVLGMVMAISSMKGEVVRG